MKSMPLRPHGLIEVADEAGDAVAIKDVKTGHDTILSMQTKSVKGPRSIPARKPYPSEQSRAGRGGPDGSYGYSYDYATSGTGPTTPTSSDPTAGSPGGSPNGTTASADAPVSTSQA